MRSIFSANDDLARLKVGDQAQQLRPIGASAGCLFAVNAGDVVALA